MSHIRLQGVRTHNLKNLNVTIPRDKLVVITGLSGSGKSSLAFDTLYAEGQRRYVESLSSYARQFLSMMEKPDVDHIEGLSPAIAIEQKSTSHNPRSTVGTVTEIYDYLRLLFARVGEPQCPDHNITLKAQTISQMVDTILALPRDTKIMVLSPIIQDRKGEHVELFSELRAKGFVRARIDGKIQELDQVKSLSKNQKHSVDIIIDRLKIRDDIRQRLAESLETGITLSSGLIKVGFLDDNNNVSTKKSELLFSAKFACPHCGYSLQELEPRLFSFNSPTGACPTCDGLGEKQLFNADYELIGREICQSCQGTRLKREARHVFIEKCNLSRVTSWSITETADFFEQLKLPGHRGEIAAKILKEIIARLLFLKNVGLEYLSLDRSAETLSGGEAQRIRLASQIGSALVGVMYILDEPSIGLHQRDNERLLKTLESLRDLGNTVLVVEHDEEAILRSDHVIDLGPGAGLHGGYIVAQGSPADIMKNPKSLTGHYLKGKKNIAIPNARKLVNINNKAQKIIEIKQAQGNNLKNITVKIPIGVMTCITGVSGSGKSTLINDTLYPEAARVLNGAELIKPAKHEKIDGLKYCKTVVEIDQAPLGRTPRSNPATYTGMFTPIRELCAGLPESRARGYLAGRFSFNVKGGRCEACEGDGVIKVAMHFLPDMYVMCDICKGMRYNRETLEIKYKHKNIYEILCMTVEEARVFFDAIPVVARKCQALIDVGLSYITLGQSATTLSGGEAQRVKLSKELSRRDTGDSLYILDEPTTGLHFHDIAQLLTVLYRLTEKGNTVIIIEHNLDVIKTADWIIDLGPEGGNGGGEVVAVGTPEQIAIHPKSHTGRFLKKVLKKI